MGPATEAASMYAASLGACREQLMVTGLAFDDKLLFAK